MILIKNSSVEFIRVKAPITEKKEVKTSKGVSFLRSTELKVFLKPNTEPKYPGNKTAALEVLANTGEIPV